MHLAVGIYLDHSDNGPTAAVVREQERTRPDMSGLAGIRQPGPAQPAIVLSVEVGYRVNFPGRWLARPSPGRPLGLMADLPVERHR